MMPWYLFFFIGAFDWGYYAHALISVENAARVAVLYTSQSSGKAADSDKACKYALAELKVVANLPSTVTTCGALPLIVTAAKKTGADSADGKDASEVQVTYQSVQLIPIPGLLQGQTTFYHKAQMRLRSPA